MKPDPQDLGLGGVEVTRLVAGSHRGMLTEVVQWLQEGTKGPKMARRKGTATAKEGRLLRNKTNYFSRVLAEITGISSKYKSYRPLSAPGIRVAVVVLLAYVCKSPRDRDPHSLC